MEHDYDKISIEEFAKEILEEKKLFKNMKKSESPDFIIDGKIGIEVTKAFESDELDGYIKAYGKDIKDIDKFNKGFIKRGGKVFHKNSTIVKILNLKKSPFHENYIHVRCGYKDDNFEQINIAINNKLKKLNNIYSKKNVLDTYDLAIVTPMNFTTNNIDNEINEIKKLQSMFKYKYRYIYIITINKTIIAFDTSNNSFKIV